jgi:hypothetical protein
LEGRFYDSGVCCASTCNRSLLDFHCVCLCSWAPATDSATTTVRRRRLKYKLVYRSSPLEFKIAWIGASHRPSHAQEASAQAVVVLRTIIQQTDTVTERLSTTWVARYTEFRDIRLDYHHFQRICSSCGASHRPSHAQQASAQAVVVLRTIIQQTDTVTERLSTTWVARCS